MQSYNYEFDISTGSQQRGEITRDGRRYASLDRKLSAQNVRNEWMCDSSCDGTCGKCNLFRVGMGVFVLGSFYFILKRL